MAPQSQFNHGLAMLQAATMVIASDSKPETPPSDTPTPHTNSSSLSALLNPAPPNAPPVLPDGFVLGKDGKIKKKRGRKPTPGLTEEDRRQARLLKNRRTAETSRKRKLALLHRLTSERDEAKQVADQLRKHNEYLTARLAEALKTTVDDLLKHEPAIAMRTLSTCVPCSPVQQSDVSRPPSTVDSDSDASQTK
eukprot:GFKZ01010902.1.p2 GENE.GFKZ01010902.1~~GFKZ01010902.1.p2  ORF type:complete len:194 (-),score=28.37 GFKZ01010902.1:92-673(-)